MLNPWMEPGLMTNSPLWIRFIEEDGQPAVLFVPFTGKGEQQQGMRAAPQQVNRAVWHSLVASARRETPIRVCVRYCFGEFIRTPEVVPTDDYERLERTLLAKMREKASELRDLLARVNDHWGYEDGLYRFYHQSFKVFGLQQLTARIVAELTSIAPEGRGFCELFRVILEPGLDREFSPDDNAHWVESTAPIVEAFLHARYFLEMAVKYAAELEEPPQLMPSGWAALLSLYGLR